MMRQTEIVMKGFQKYMDSLPKKPETKEELDAALAEYMVIYNTSIKMQGNSQKKEEDMTSDDYLMMAEEATSRTKRQKYLKKALELDENNIDAARRLANMTAKAPIELLNLHLEILDRAKRLMEEEDLFSEECIGKFWMITETRPFMRQYQTCAFLFLRNGMIRQAAKAFLEMLRLCEGDNLGVRYDLMTCYMELEDEEKAEKLYKDYEEEETVMFLLPLSIIHYRLGNEEKAKEYIDKLREINKDTATFFKSMARGKTPKNKDEYGFGYTMGTISEYIECLNINSYSYHVCPSYWIWAGELFGAGKLGRKRG